MPRLGGPASGRGPPPASAPCRDASRSRRATSSRSRLGRLRGWLPLPRAPRPSGPGRLRIWTGSCCSQTRASRRRGERHGADRRASPSMRPRSAAPPGCWAPARGRCPPSSRSFPRSSRPARSAASGARRSPRRSAASVARKARRSRHSREPRILARPRPRAGRPRACRSRRASSRSARGRESTGRQTVVASVMSADASIVAASAVGPSSHGRAKSRWSLAHR